MGKRLIQQRRGRGGRYKAPSHRYLGKVSYIRNREPTKGRVIDIKHDPARSAPVAVIALENTQRNILLPAAEGMMLGQEIMFNHGDVSIGNVLPLKDIPEGTQIYNIEINPGDGGKLCRSSGGFAIVVGHEKGKTTIRLPSRKFKILKSTCRATIGKVAGSGRVEQPFVKAGKKFYAAKARNKLYPVVSGVAMNAVDHPFGGSAKPGKHKTVKRDVPPGKKVGSIAARRTGKGKKK
ncbi:MAG: 50S ribosomal protein L2 [Candidatus Aenigmarchaeota archaeon ex4484_14]|nr:MAG: 50S ribosomal protein L2 [Candidatus Aenigmarchaeota archaeon ex4484_14]